jgi:hypothetical protein
MIPRLVRGLLGMRRGGRWRSTHDAAWALIALDDARRALAAPSAVEARVFLDGEAITSARLSPFGAPVVAQLPAARLLAAPGAALTFEARDGALYYEGLLRFARKELPRAPLEHGIAIERVARPRSPGPVRAGDYVDLVLLVTTPLARDQVVLDDPLPAGFESVDASYLTTMRAAADVDHGDAPFAHREMRDDRVLTLVDRLPAGSHRYTYVVRATTPGRYVVPPAKAECMYAPDIYGRTAASVVDVR